MRRRPATIALGVLILIGAGPTLARLAPGMMTPLRAFIVAAGACFVAMALSLNMVSGHAGMPSLGHGALLATGALTSGLVTGRLYLPFGVGLVAATALTASLAWVLGAATVRLGPTAFAMVTLVVGLIVDQSLFRWQWLTEGLGMLVLSRPQVGSFVFDASGDYLAIAAAGAVTAWFVDGQVKRSPFGRAMHLVRADEQSAQALGIDPVANRLTAFVFAGALAGMAGAVFGHLVITVSADTFRYTAMSLPLLSLVIIGGAGSRAGVTAVSFLYSVMPRILVAIRGWDAVVAALLFIFSVARNPGGLSATVGRARRRRLDRPADRPTPFLEGSEHAAVESANQGQEGPAVLAVSGLDVNRGGAAVLRDVALEVSPGRVTAVVGPNGAGKTTLLDAISGFVACAAGRVLLSGTDVTEVGTHRRRGLGVGRTFQRGGLPLDMSVREALMVSGDDHGHRSLAESLLGLPKASRREQEGAQAVDKALDSLGLTGFGAVPIGELSVGQQRLVELTAALGGGQRVLLLDEPSAGLARSAVGPLSKRIRALADAGIAFLVVEHDLELVRAVSDEVVVLVDGEVIANGPPSEVLANTDVIAAWLGGVSTP